VNEVAKDKMKAFRLWMTCRTSENRALYENKRNTRNKIIAEEKVPNWNRLCEDLEQDLKGNKKLLFHLAKFYRKGTTEKIKVPASRIINKHWEYNKPLYIAFLDLEKAFDRIPEESYGNPCSRMKYRITW